jgi:hypothetical protein
MYSRRREIVKRNTTNDKPGQHNNPDKEGHAKKKPGSGSKLAKLDHDDRTRL